MRKKRRFVILDRTLLYVIFGIIILLFSLNFITTQQKNKIKRLEDEIAAVQEELVHYKHITELVSKIEEARASIESRIEEFQKLDNRRAFWIEHFSAMGNSMPEFVWFTSYSFAREVIEIRGISYSIQTIATLMVQLLKANVFDYLNITYIKEGNVQDYGKAFFFELKSELPALKKKTDEQKEDGSIDAQIKGKLGTRESAKQAGAGLR